MHADDAEGVEAGVRRQLPQLHPLPGDLRRVPTTATTLGSFRAVQHDAHLPGGSLSINKGSEADLERHIWH